MFLVIACAKKCACGCVGVAKVCIFVGFYTKVYDLNQ